MTTKIQRWTLLGCLFLLAGLGCNVQDARAQGSSKVPFDIPEFTLFRLDDNKVFTRAQLSTTDQLVLIFFDPGCGHCQREASLIGEHLAQFKNTSFYFISMQDKHLIRTFQETFGKKLKNKPNVHFLHDSKYEFMGKFNPLEYPSIYIYNKEKRLVQYLHGNIPFERIKAVLGVAP
jgi:peroxiredoxin